MHDVADKVGYAGIIGAIAAAIGALALACRSRGPKMNPSPTGFPNDANASLSKYQTAYLDLVKKSTSGPDLTREAPATASDYALIAFAEAKGASKIVSPKQPAPDTPPGNAGGD